MPGGRIELPIWRYAKRDNRRNTCKNRGARFHKPPTSFSVPKLPVSDRHRGLSGGNEAFGVIFQAESGDLTFSSNKSQFADGRSDTS